MPDLDKFFEDLSNVEPQNPQPEGDENLDTDDSLEDGEGQAPPEGGDLDEGQQQNQEPKPRKYAGRFDSVEQLEKSYKELQSRDTKLSQILQKINQNQQQPQSVPPPSGAFPQELAGDPRFVALMQQNPQQANALIQQYQAQQAQMYQQQQMMNEIRNSKIQQEVLALKVAHGAEFEEVAGDIPALMDANPWLWNAPTPITTAYQLARANKLQTITELASASTAASTAEKLRQKKAGGIDSTQQRTQPTKKTPEEEIAESILGNGRSGGKPSAFF